MKYERYYFLCWSLFIWNLLAISIMMKYMLECVVWGFLWQYHAGLCLFEIFNMHYAWWNMFEYEVWAFVWQLDYIKKKSHTSENLSLSTHCWAKSLLLLAGNQNSRLNGSNTELGCWVKGHLMLGKGYMMLSKGFVQGQHSTVIFL